MGEGDVDLEAVLAEIEAATAARVAAGEYPADLDARLEAHYARIVEQLPRPFDHARLDAAISRVAQAAKIDPAAISTSSGVPGGSTAHGVVARLVRRQTAGLAEQLNRFTAAVTDALSVIVEASRHPMSHGHPDMQGAIDLILDETALAVPFAAPADVDWRPVLDRVEAGADGVVAVERPRDLEGVADGSLDLVNALGALGRIPPHTLLALAAGAHQKLRTGGTLLVAGIEPVSFDAIAAASAVSPFALVHPAYLEALLAQAGFGTAVDRVGDRGAFAVVATRQA